MDIVVTHWSIYIDVNNYTTPTHSEALRPTIYFYILLISYIDTNCARLCYFHVLTILEVFTMLQLTAMDSFRQDKAKIY